MNGRVFNHEDVTRASLRPSRMTGSGLRSNYDTGSGSLRSNYDTGSGLRPNYDTGSGSMRSNHVAGSGLRLNYNTGSGRPTPADSTLTSMSSYVDSDSVYSLESRLDKLIANRSSVNR
jgi:hypothetical protein